MDSLDLIAIRNGTDKSSQFHNYCEKYEKYLPFDRLSNIKILEIGVCQGESIKMWKEFYPNATIVGLDINPNCKQYERKKEGMFIEIGSQDDPDFLKTLTDKYQKFDMVLDDGSHMQHHMIYSFEFLFDFVKDQGIYVLEDTCCSYWPGYGGSIHGKNTVINYFKNLVDHVNFYGAYQKNISWNARREDYLIEQSKNDNIRLDIESINFLNSIIIVNKR